MGYKTSKAKIEQADGSGSRKKTLKKRKARVERRKAKVNPEIEPGYKKFRGYQL